MGCVPCIRGLRIPVATVVAMFPDGMAEREIVTAYPDRGRGHSRVAALRRRGSPRALAAAGRSNFLIDDALSPVVAERLETRIRGRGDGYRPAYEVY